MFRAQIILLAVVVAPCQAAVVATKGVCPSTSIKVSVSEDAAGTPQWLDATECTEPDACVSVGTDKVKRIEICGPGTFSVSRMSCDRHDYKALVLEHPTTDFTATDCKKYDVAGHLLCLAHELRSPRLQGPDPRAPDYGFH